MRIELRKYLLTFLTVATLTSCIGQTTIFSDDNLLNSRTESYTFIINGVTLKPSKEKINIFPNYPAIDTIIFFDSQKRSKTQDTIFIRLPKNKSFILTIGCCEEGFDIFEEKK